MLTEERNYYKPFQYNWAFEAYKSQQHMHWLPDEVPMADDLKEQFQESIANSLSKKDLHCVILDEDAIIGHFFLWSAQDEIPELAIAVADSHHSRGIGNALLLYFEIVGKF